MAGYQFIHVECYSDKRHSGKSSKNSASGVVKEAVRMEHATPHVENPKPVRYEHGEDLEQWFQEQKQIKDGALFETSNSKSGYAKPRKDFAYLTAGVASYPHSWESEDFNQQDYDEWKSDTVTFLQETYGKKLGVVIEHSDEKFPHLHFYAGLEQKHRPDGTYGVVPAHQGKRAETYNKHDKPRKQAYTEAMEDFQNEYFGKVSIFHGQDRTGPKRKRYSRAEWQARQQDVEMLAQNLKEVKSLKETLNKVLQEMKDVIKAIPEKAQQYIKDTFNLGGVVDNFKNAKKADDNFEVTTSDKKKNKFKM